MKLIEWIAPNFLVKKAYQKLSLPEVQKLRPHEQNVLNSARKSSHRYKAFDIAFYTWGHGPKKALLIHGWEGHAGNFAAIVPLLVDRGYTVHAFDAPSHGSSTHAESSLFDYKDVVKEFLARENYPLIISHSFGSVPLTYALAEHGAYPLHHLVMITTPDTLTDRVEQITSQMKFSQKIADLIIERFEKETGKDPRLLTVSEFVKGLRPTKALIFHGSEDKVLPLEWSERIQKQLANSELKVLAGYGHYKILYSEPLLQEIDQLITSV